MDHRDRYDNNDLEQLIDKWLQGTASKEEWNSLLQHVDNPELEKVLLARWESRQEAITIPDWEEKCDILLNGNKTTQVVPVHRVHFLRTAWFRYAAAIIILFGVGTYIYVSNQKEKPSVTQTNPVPVQNDVAPGGNRATLTLADGTKIILDAVANGVIAKEGSTAITKRDGMIEYDSRLTSDVSRLTSFNTMATPRGGQYQLTLPDGSQVWLNAESSITYPTAFSGSERKVSITGEAYFEVAKNKAKPFRVDIGTATIEVLGTHFNVNTYKEEPTKNITLIEGSVKIKLLPSAVSPRPSKPGEGGRLTNKSSVHTSLILKPGQQGQLNPRTEKLSLAANPDVEQVVSWKNGVFNFNEVSLKDAMRQLSRWYDVEIVYEGKVPDMTFVGKIGRDLKLSQVLKGLGEMGIKFRIEGRRLIVTQ
jgi:transmembrane sensor